VVAVLREFVRGAIALGEVDIDTEDLGRATRNLDQHMAREDGYA